MDYDKADALNQAIRLLTLRHRARAAALLATIGLHPGQDALLLELDRNGPMIQAQVAEAIGCEPPSVTVMARKLLAGGYLQRTPSPQDRRASIIDLTPAGRELTGELKRLWQTLADQSVTGLGETDVDEITAALTAMADNLRVDGGADGTRS